MYSKNITKVSYKTCTRSVYVCGFEIVNILCIYGTFVVCSDNLIIHIKKVVCIIYNNGYVILERTIYGNDVKEMRCLMVAIETLFFFRNVFPLYSCLECLMQIFFYYHVL